MPRRGFGRLAAMPTGMRRTGAALRGWAAVGVLGAGLRPPGVMRSWWRGGQSPPA